MQSAGILRIDIIPKTVQCSNANCVFPARAQERERVCVQRDESSVLAKSVIVHGGQSQEKGSGLGVGGDMEVKLVKHGRHSRVISSLQGMSCALRRARGCVMRGSNEAWHAARCCAA